MLAALAHSGARHRAVRADRVQHLVPHPSNRIQRVLRGLEHHGAFLPAKPTHLFSRKPQHVHDLIVAASIVYFAAYHGGLW